MTDSLKPENWKISNTAWKSITGGYDLHVHVDPDVVPRRIDDIDLAHEFLEYGMKGFVLKSHYFPTVERAKVVSKSVPGISAFGSLTMNHSVGGFNPVLVDVAGKSGNRIVWMPTVDAANERLMQQTREPHKLPFWAAIQQELVSKGFSPWPLSVLDSSGELNDKVKICLDLIAEYDMVLATGHLSKDEIFALVPAAVKAGVKRIIVTHALFPSENLSPTEQSILSEMGAFIEHCFANFYTGKASWERLVDSIQKVGPKHTLLTTDLGQAINPPVASGFARFAQILLDANLSFDDVHMMAVENSTRLVEPDLVPIL